MPTPIEAYRELCARVDAFFARVEARHGGEMRCAVGCDDCCHARLSVTGVEAAVIAAHVAAMAPEARAHVASLAARPVADASRPRCAALDDDGRCTIYDARPLVCRSHGVPIRLRAPGTLPVVQACRLNFTARGPGAADADCVLDQQTLSATLLTIDRLHAGETGGEAGSRVELVDLLR